MTQRQPRVSFLITCLRRLRGARASRSQPTVPPVNATSKGDIVPYDHTRDTYLRALDREIAVRGPAWLLSVLRPLPIIVRYNGIMSTDGASTKELGVIIACWIHSDSSTVKPGVVAK